MQAHLKIPDERVGALIGDKRRELIKIEKATRTNITVEENNVAIEGEALHVWAAQDIVRAVGRGFSPARALKLLEDATLQVVDLGEFSESRLRTVRSRIIGRNGRTRGVIEEITGVYISVYGKTVSVIGGDGAAAAIEAIGMLIKGARHASVYAHLEQWRKEQRLMGELHG
ncbi:MAG: RNA-processing protein [Candidatus Aenigmarchaeota archaeon]|nr:RNA-processing protein [Candidatus Aenigmarchaeota archaeon]